MDSLSFTALLNWQMCCMQLNSKRGAETAPSSLCLSLLRSFVVSGNLNNNVNCWCDLHVSVDMVAQLKHFRCILGHSWLQTLFVLLCLSSFSSLIPRHFVWSVSILSLSTLFYHPFVWLLRNSAFLLLSFRMNALIASVLLPTLQGRNNIVVDFFMKYIAAIFSKTLDQGAATQVKCLVDPKLKGEFTHSWTITTSSEFVNSYSILPVASFFNSDWLISITREHNSDWLMLSTLPVSSLVNSHWLIWCLFVVLGTGGTYWSDCKQKTPSKLARDAALAEKLWKVSQTFYDRAIKQ